MTGEKSNTLANKWRPNTFDEVVGQDAVVDSLVGLCERNSSQAFLLQGPSGTGKTTLARIAARSLGCALPFYEIDAATHTGVDDMRSVQEALRYAPLGKVKRRAIIIDECHRLSANAWDSLLKSVEEPPKHIVWFFCTTNAAKVPNTIKTRCTGFTLKAVSDDDLLYLIKAVAKTEKFKASPAVLDLVVKEANGSPRQALSNLSVCANVTDRKDAATVLRSAVDNDATIQFCRFIAKGGSWAMAMSHVKALVDTNPESVRIVTTNYIGAILKNAKKDEEAMRLLQILDAFAEPYTSSTEQTQLMISIGRVLFTE